MARLPIHLFLCCVTALLLVTPVAGNLTPATMGSSPGSAQGPVSYSLPSISGNVTPGFFLREYTFPFQSTRVTVRANISANLYYGAQNGEKFARVPENATPEEMAPAYYRAFMDDPAQEPVYAALIGQFRAVRQDLRLSDDEYLELITVFVQNLTYDASPGTQADTPARFPVETLVDRTGDCDDKSLLLAGLLSREGYNVSLLLFIPEHHMAIGVGGDGDPYGNTGYLYTETTGIAFVGEVPKKLNLSGMDPGIGGAPGQIVLNSTPVVIRAGNGSKRFTMGNETRFIVAQKALADGQIAYLNRKIAASSQEDPVRYRQLLETYHAWAAIHNTVTTHRYDRAGMYRYVSSWQYPSCPACKPTLMNLPLPVSPSRSNVTAFQNPGPPRVLFCPDGYRTRGMCPWPDGAGLLIPRIS